MKFRSKQQGYALLIFVILLATAAAAVTVKALNSNSGNSQIARDKITAAALAQAKDALIGYTASDAARPGELPCPDINNDGIITITGPNADYSGSNCISLIGRLPWRTLGLQDLRDGDGERLWYAVSDPFHANSAAVLNSDTRGTLPVYAQDGTTLITNQAVAVIFSPGDVLAGQSRGAVNDATQYLEKLNCPGANCRDNTVATGPFIAGPVFDANRNPLLNDRLMVIQTKDIIPAVEKRVAKELNNWLQAYYATNHYYPYPAKYDECGGSSCDGVTTVCRGRIPKSAAAGNAAVPWPLDGWFVHNQWYREIYYSVGFDSLKPPLALDSPACGASLAVSESGNVRAIFFTPGTPIGSIVRPSNNLSEYLEDAKNQDGWGHGASNSYDVPTSHLNDRDRIFTLP